MKQLSTSLLFILITLGCMAMKTPQKKEIKVQIMHHNQVVVDTVLYVDEDQAGEVLQNYVNQFSKNPIAIDTKTVHGLYSFNITNEQWVDPNKKNPVHSANSDYPSNTWTVNVDSLFDEVSGEIKKTWEKASIEVYIDSVSEAISRFDVNKFKKQINDVSADEFSQDIKDLWGKIKSTRVVIIHDADSVQIPPKKTP